MNLKNWIIVIGLMVVAVFTVACDDDEILPGTRLAVFAANQKLLTQGQTQPVVLPRPYENQSWQMQGGVATHANYHLAISGSPKKRWVTNIGNEENARQKIVAQPLIVNNMVYAMDATMNVSAHALDSGKLLWRVNVRNPNENNETFGGGLTFAEDKLYITTGDAEMYALSPRTGKAIWRTRLAGPARSGATYEGGYLYVQTLNNRTEAFNANSGQKIWTHRGIEEISSIVGTSAPAVEGDFVYIVYSSGEVYALIKKTGGEIWTDIISSARPMAGRLQLELPDIKALPVVDRGKLFVTSNGGLTVAYDLSQGLPLWEYHGGGTQTPAVGQTHIFLVTNDGTAVALDRETGQPAWIKDLGTNATRSGGKKIEWYGPLIASNRLLWANSRGKLVALSPFDGRLLGEIELGNGVVVPPSIAKETLIFITKGANLLAYQ